MQSVCNKKDRIFITTTVSSCSFFRCWRSIDLRKRQIRILICPICLYCNREVWKDEPEEKPFNSVSLKWTQMYGWLTASWTNRTLVGYWLVRLAKYKPRRHIPPKTYDWCSCNVTLCFCIPLFLNFFRYEYNYVIKVLKIGYWVCIKWGFSYWVVG